MNALSPVSADLISRLRAACVAAEKEAAEQNRTLFVDWIGYRLLARAEKAARVRTDVATLEDKILIFLGANPRVQLKRHRK